MSDRLNDEQRKSWIDALEAFRDDVYPSIFQPFGFTLPEAYTIWRLNHIDTDLGQVVEELRELNREPVDDWQKGDGDSDS